MEFEQKLHLYHTAIAVKSWQVGRPIEDVRFQQHTPAIDITGVDSWAGAKIGYAR